ncbi:reduced growth phenotype 1 rgp1 -related [Anaeramoeba flamelloides]|uniref:Reduced growth phenotype 1 rgp1 -related n=1 Tax=Anaeramoeba flamelloides TaxID=1746091 RepID=A0AAV7Z420_9EUKA|nr:reduced growth phenotype 1 rgp1 -related [Anaeramoeba flamelloides]
MQDLKVNWKFDHEFYFPGSEVNCKLIFKSTPTVKQPKSIPLFYVSGKTKGLIDSRMVKLKQNSKRSEKKQFGVGDLETKSGEVLFETESQIVCTDISIQPFKKYSCNYKITLPNWIPPTFHGTSITILYYILINYQSSINNISSIKIPLRIFCTSSGK